MTARGDVLFRPGERGKLDIYMPAASKSAPVVVFFYGGSWDEGRRQDYRFVGLALARWRAPLRPHVMAAILPGPLAGALWDRGRGRRGRGGST